MSRVNRKRGISIALHEFKSRYILPKRGEKSKLKRESHRLDRHGAKAALRKEWAAEELGV